MPSAEPVPEDVLLLRAALGERIRVIREARKLSQDQLAAQIGLSRVSVSNIETAVHSPTVDRLMMIAMAFGMPLDDLVRGLVPARRPPGA